MNDDQQKEYEEHYSPDGEYIQYQMENPEMNDQKSKSKQDILNAFREHFHPDVRVMPGAPLDEDEMWLLTALTEFERETIKDVLWLIDCEDDCAKTDGEDTKILSNLKNRIGGHFELEKDLHPSK